MKKAYRGMFLFALAFIFQFTTTFPNIVDADEEKISITELNLKVMPEFVNPEGWDFNQPSLLVGYHGTFTNNTDQPYNGELKVAIPTDLPQFTPGFVAQYKEETEEHIELSYEISEQGKYFVWTPPEPIPANGKFHFVLEFFSAPIKGDVERSFRYQFEALNQLDNVNLAFYAPFKVTDFKVSQEPTETTNSFGVEIQFFKYGQVAQGEVLDFDVTYTKDNVVTTVEAFNDMNAPKDDVHQGFNEAGSSEETNQTDGGAAKTSTSIFSSENVILAIVAFVILVAFLFIAIKKKRKPTEKPNDASIAPKKIINKEEEIKRLRKLLADGQIDEKTYKENRAQLD